MRHRPISRLRSWLPVVAAGILVACGGGGGAPGAGTGNGTNTDTPPVNATPLPTVAVTQWRLAQTHVLPADGLRWSQPDGKTLELHLSGGRPALALVDLGAGAWASPQVEGRVGESLLGSVPLRDNTALPPTEDDGERYSATARVAALPADWLQPGLQLRVSASEAQPSAWQAVNVGPVTTLDIRSLPFYLFGATEQVISAARASTPSAQAMDELVAKWPISRLSIVPHAATRVDWPQLVIGPRNGQAAYVMNRYEDRLDGFDPIATVQNTLGLMRAANGESATANQYYGALVQAKATGGYAANIGGIGGGHVGAGDASFAGVFIHEQGHAFGMPHAGESNAAGTGYPYAGGSLNGSAWGFDAVRQRFMSPRVPTSASTFAKCATQTFNGTPRQLDAQGRCIRQDPMQSGSGDQAAGDVFTLFSDYNAGVVQKYLEGVASLDANGKTVWDGGRVQESAASATGYRRWNSLTGDWVEVDPTLDGNRALYGIDNQYPAQRGVPVYTVVLSRSLPGTVGATAVMPPIGPWTGNLVRLPDPTQATDLAALKPSVGAWGWYCMYNGCDNTLRVTYADGTVRHIVLQKAFRPWFKPNDAPDAAANDPLAGESFRRWAVNVPADRELLKVELLDTPTVFNGLPAQPAVLASRSMP